MYSLHEKDMASVDLANSASSVAAPSAKEQKYDRQLRLWGGHGQKALEDSHVLVVGATATGCELVKNLVLPSIGSFTILDGATTSEADVGSNFFLTKSCVGEPRASSACKLLCELNGDVQGEYVCDTVENILQNNIEFLDQFNVVIATEMARETMLELAAACWERGIVFVRAVSYGLMGMVRVSAPGAHTIIESHQSNPVVDLRITTPFPELDALADALDLDALDDHDHELVPYPVLLLHCLRKWRETHGDAAFDRTTKREFKQFIKDMRRDTQEGNFNEAVAKALRCWVPTRVPDHVQAVFDAPEATGALPPDADPFWFVVAGLKRFVADTGALPVSGVLPDMVSSTANYMALQGAYQAKAAQDAAVVTDLVAEAVAEAGAPDVSPELISKMCKNAFELSCAQFSSLASEYNNEAIDAGAYEAWLANDDSNFSLYAAYRAAELFHATHRRWPGADDACVDTDVTLLQECAATLLADWSMPNSVSLNADIIQEFCRYGNAELHTTASIIGGVASQEIIKVVTHQFQPMSNTYIFNGVNGSGSVFRL